MKPRYLVGGLLVFLGIVWIVGVTRLLITDFLDVQVRDLVAWADQIYFPASSWSTFFYIVFLLAWIFYSTKARFSSSSQAKTSLTLWLLLFLASIVSNIAVLIFCIQTITVIGLGSAAAPIGGNFTESPPYEYLIPLTLINGLLLFWLPSCFLTQKTIRFVPPFSHELTSLIEKR